MTDKKISECLANEQPNRVTPFFWQHGDSRDELLHMIEVIYSANMDSFCVESRVHPDFCREKWWEDFGYILSEAEKRNMKVWLLDDKHFPSGFANDYITEHKELARKLIRYEFADVCGAARQTALLANRCEEGEKLLYVLAYRRFPGDERLSAEFYNLTESAEDGLVRFDLPDGFWRVFFIIETDSIITAKDDTKFYVDMLSSDSCDAMLKAVYEPHYQHFKEYFGNTFLGFFSDEPCFNNEKGTYYSKLGKKNMLLPWNGELIGEMAKKTGKSDDDIIALLPALWFDTEKDTAEIRYAYMDAVSEAYSRNFPQKIGEWCQRHGVSYIGHVIEDMDAHMRLGYGSGHFFRALSGQDMSGIDVVLHQIVPGFSEITHHAMIADGGTADPEFFDYTLAKLGASAAHIDSRKNGRCMCEMFGAYGWAEGLPIMKYLADHMLINGVNYFVPHAFTNRYPNDDCPPHFWGGGMNPQFKYFGELINYMNRCVHMLSEGIHRADAAVLYPAEGEWCGGKTVPAGKVAKQLTQHQIDFDFLPFDALKKTDVKDRKLIVEKEAYSVLIIPFARIWPDKVLNTLTELANKGLKIIFADAFPELLQNGETVSLKEELFAAVPAVELAEYLKTREICSVICEDFCPNLRIYHITRGETEVYMLFNDSIKNRVDTVIYLPHETEAVLYDPWSGGVYRETEQNGGFAVLLEPQETRFMVFEKCRHPELEYAYKPRKLETKELTYDIYTREIGGAERLFAENSKPLDITAAKGMSRFCGEIRYTASFDCSCWDEVSEIGLDYAGETAELYLNGEYCGLRIQPPYSFNVSGKLKPKDNRVEIRVTNNPAYRERDRFSKYLALSPSGLLGNVSLYAKR